MSAAPVTYKPRQECYSLVNHLPLKSVTVLKGFVFSHPTPGTGSFLSPSLPGIVQYKFVASAAGRVVMISVVNRHLTACKRLCIAHLGTVLKVTSAEDVNSDAFWCPLQRKNAKCCLLCEVSGPLVAMSFNEELELLHCPQSGTFPECWKQFLCRSKVSQQSQMWVQKLPGCSRGLASCGTWGAEWPLCNE